MLKLFLVAGVFLATIIAVYAACTFQVGDPQIDITCVEVDFPGVQTRYCNDAGTKTPAAQDAGRDSRE